MSMNWLRQRGKKEEKQPGYLLPKLMRKSYKYPMGLRNADNTSGEYGRYWPASLIIKKTKGASPRERGNTWKTMFKIRSGQPVPINPTTFREASAGTWKKATEEGTLPSMVYPQRYPWSKPNAASTRSYISHTNPRYFANFLQVRAFDTMTFYSVRQSLLCCHSKRWQ